MEDFDATDHVPTTFPCGHSCCMIHTVDMLICFACRAKIPSNPTPNITLRDMSIELTEMAQKMAGLMSPPKRTALAAPATAAAIAPSASIAPSAVIAAATAAAADAITMPLTIDFIPSDVKKKAKRKKKKNSAAAAVGAPFFLFLPLDLQIEVLQTWLGQKPLSEYQLTGSNLICLVSALDVAVCNRASREAFLALIRQVTFPEMMLYSQVQPGSMEPRAMDNGSYIRWLHARQLKVTALFATLQVIGWSYAMDTIRLPHVAYADFDRIRSLQHVECVLKACPNLTALKWSSLCYELQGENIWDILDKLPHLALSKLEIGDDARNEEGVLSVVYTFCEHLTEVKFSNDCGLQSMEYVLPALARCRQLSKLELSAEKVPVHALIRMIVQCELLVDLELYLFEGTLDELQTLAQTCGHLRKLKVSAPYWQGEMHLQAMTFVLEHCPWLDQEVEFGQVARCSVLKKSLFLKLTRDVFPIASVDALLRVCPVINCLQLTIDRINDELMVKAGEILGKSLKTVVAFASPMPQLTHTMLQLLLRCPLLQTFICFSCEFSAQEKQLLTGRALTCVCK